MDTASIINTIRGLDYLTLKTILPVVETELDRKNPETIERDRKMNDYWAARKKEQEYRDNALDLAYQSLKRVLIPGTRLKMRGCKDGQGLREFIRWDGQNLVCWQIKYRRSWDRVAKRWDEEFVNTNIVTTHMPDKVSGVYGRISGQLVPMKNILGGIIPA